MKKGIEILIRNYTQKMIVIIPNDGGRIVVEPLPSSTKSGTVNIYWRTTEGCKEGSLLVSVLSIDEDDYAAEGLYIEELDVVVATEAVAQSLTYPRCPRTSDPDVKSDEHSEEKVAVFEAVNGAVMGENVHFNINLQQTLKEGADDVIGQAQRYQHNPSASQAGYVAEADLCRTFNARKALGRDSTRAVRQPNGNHGDYKIVKGDKVLVEGEVKYYATAEKTENAMRGYDDQQLVGPMDQIDDIKDIAAKKAAKNSSSDSPKRQQVGKEHEAVAENVSDSITDGKTKSTPRTRAEAKKIADEATKGKITPESGLPPLKESLGKAALSGSKAGAICGAVVGGGFSAFSNTKTWLDGDKDGAEALTDTAIDIGRSAADGAVKGGAASAATVAATHVAGKVASPIAKTILKSSAPATVAICAVEFGKHAIDLARGEIDGQECAEKIAKSAATGAGAWGGAQAGAAVGSLLGPGGALVCGIMGGFLGAIGIGCFFD